MVKFSVHAQTTASPTELVEEFFDVSHWNAFQGWGPIPGILEAKIFQDKGANVGTKFHVKNTDGSSHEETVIEFLPSQRMTIRIDNFSRPLNKIADHFIEIWEFSTANDITTFERRFELYPKNFTGAILLRVIAYFLKNAIKAHTKQIVLDFNDAEQ